MPRRKPTPRPAPSEATLGAAAELAKMCSRKGPPKKRARSISEARFRAVLVEMGDLVKANDWKDATAVHFVALYAYLHDQIYGFAPGELTARERMAAAGAASRMLSASFDGDPDDMVDFMRWTWRREASRERWRRENHRPGGKLTWRFQFSGRALDEYRADLMRSRGKG